MLLPHPLIVYLPPAGHVLFCWRFAAALAPQPIDGPPKLLPPWQLCVLYVCADHVQVTLATRVASGCCCRHTLLAVRPSYPLSCAHTVPCRDWEVVDSRISLSPSQLSKISVVQSLVMATVTFQVPASCDGSKTLTAALGG